MRHNVLIYWFPHAGNVEIFQLLVALAGVLYGARNLRGVWEDRRSALRYGLPIDRETARANLESEIEKWVIQWGLVFFGLWSLTIAPPPPALVREIWALPEGSAVISQQAVIVAVSVLLMWRSRRDRIARHRIMALADAPDSDVSLLERLGGPFAIERIVADLYARLLRDPVLCHYFQGLRLDRLVHAQTDLLTQLLGGEPSTVDLRATHARLKIPPEDFERFVDVCRATLAGFEVPAQLSERVIQIILSTRDQIVTRTQP